MANEPITPARPGSLRTWFHNSGRLLQVLWRHRAFFRSMMRGARRKREIQRVDLKAADGVARRMPADVNLYLTDDCNLRCRMCGRYRENGPFAGRRPGAGDERQIDLETYSRLFEELGDRPTFYYLSGGEPLLYRHGVAELVSRMKRQPATVALNTNGTLLAEQADDLVAAGLDLILVSLDGPREVNDAVRGEGVFERAAEGIRRLHEARRRRGRSNPVVSVILTASPWNWEAVDSLPDLARELDLEMAGVNFMQFTDEERGRASEEIWKKEFGVEARAWKGYVIDVGGIDLDRFREGYRRLLSAGKRFLFYTMPPQLAPSSLGAFYRDLGDTLGRKQCWKPWYRAYVRPNGDVTTCEHFCDCVVGNVVERRMSDIWNGEGYRRFRRVLRERGYFPFCTRCISGLFEV